MIRNMQKLFDLSGKAAVITGAGSGLGQGIAEGYAQLGAGVSVVDVNLEAAQSVTDGIQAAGGEAISVPCDVTQQDQVQAAVAQTLEEFGKIDILVNAIAPSHIRTPLIAKLMQDKPEVRTYYLNNIALNRLGEVEDVVGPAIFLASDAAAFVTGHVLVADGGHTAK